MDMELFRPLSSALPSPPRTVRLHGIAENTRYFCYQCAGMSFKTPPTKETKLPEETQLSKCESRAFLPGRANEHRDHDGHGVQAHPSGVTRCRL